MRKFAAMVTGLTLLTCGTAQALDPRGEGEMCGGIAAIQCKDGLFCDTTIEAQCGAGDMSGTCAAKPQVCIRIYKPVCGCDGKTYGNDCERQGAGVGKRAEGACEG